MNSAIHLSQDDLALFALQLLPANEQAAALEHVRNCESCRLEVAQIQGEMAAYAMVAESHEPPAGARERLMRTIERERKTIPIDRPQAQPVDESAAEPLLSARNSRLLDREGRDERPPRRGAGLLAWTGWAVAAGLAVVAGLEYQQREATAGSLNEASAHLQESAAESARAQKVLQTITDANAMQVALHLPATPGATPKPEAHAAYVADRGALVFIASNLEPLQVNKTYELWLLPAAAGQNPIPAGLFKPDPGGNASVVLPDLPKGVAAKGFGVTIEADGGSAQPTPPIVLAGT